MTSLPQIDGLVMTPLRELADARGAVLHMLRADAPPFRGFGECYFSEIKPGIIKGWKRHRLQTQNLAVPHGRVRFAVFDNRESSRTTGRLELIELGRPDAYRLLSIPPMLWYVFACISATPALIANCTDVPHDPAESEVLELEAFENVKVSDLLGSGAGN